MQSCLGWWNLKYGTSLLACGFAVGGFRKGTMASAHLFVWEKAVLQLLPWCQTFQFFLVCCWCLSSCYPGARAQSGWVWVSLCVGSLRGTAWISRCFFHWLNPHWFLQPEIVGTYVPGTGILGWGAWWRGYLVWEAWYGVSIPHSWVIPLEFLSTICGSGTSPFCISAPPTSLDGCGFFNSVVVWLPFYLISDGSEWWLLYILVLILMWLCKEVSCVYTYGTILTGSPQVYLLTKDV